MFCTSQIHLRFQKAIWWNFTALTHVPNTFFVRKGDRDCAKYSSCGLTKQKTNCWRNSTDQAASDEAEERFRSILSGSLFFAPHCSTCSLLCLYSLLRPCRLEHFLLQYSGSVSMSKRYNTQSTLIRSIPLLFSLKRPTTPPTFSYHLLIQLYFIVSNCPTIVLLGTWD